MVLSGPDGSELALRWLPVDMDGSRASMRSVRRQCYPNEQALFTIRCGLRLPLGEAASDGEGLSSLLLGSSSCC